MVRHLILFLFLSSVSHLVIGQVNLTVTPIGPPSASTDCSLIYFGESTIISSSTSCGLDIEILRDSGISITGIGTVVDKITSTPYTMTFDTLGLYSFYCLGSGKVQADQCFHVIPTPTPTLSQWGLIILFLLFTCVSVVVITDKKTLPITL